MKTTMRLAICVLVLASVDQIAGASFSTLPSDGALAGQAGQMLGWGYSIENHSNAWLVPVGLNANGILFGSLTDIYDYSVVAPLSTVTMPYQFSSPGGAGFSSGLFEYVVPGIAPAGSVQSGSFVLQYQFFTDNPDTNSSAVAIGPILVSSAQAFSVTAIDPVPEPGTGGSLLLLVFLGRVYLGRKCVRQSSST